MAKPLVSDELWELIEPLLPLVLKTGIPWEDLPQEMGRRLRDWQRAGVWERIHLICLERLQQADRIDWRAVPRQTAPL